MKMFFSFSFPLMALVNTWTSQLHQNLQNFILSLETRVGPVGSVNLELHWNVWRFCRENLRDAHTDLFLDAYYFGVSFVVVHWVFWRFFAQIHGVLILLGIFRLFGVTNISGKTKHTNVQQYPTVSCRYPTIFQVPHDMRHLTIKSVKKWLSHLWSPAVSCRFVGYACRPLYSLGIHTLAMVSCFDHQYSWKLLCWANPGNVKNVHSLKLSSVSHLNSIDALFCVTSKNRSAKKELAGELLLNRSGLSLVNSAMQKSVESHEYELEWPLY